MNLVGQKKKKKKNLQLFSLSAPLWEIEPNSNQRRTSCRKHGVESWGKKRRRDPQTELIHESFSSQKSSRFRDERPRASHCVWRRRWFIPGRPRRLRDDIIFEKRIREDQRRQVKELPRSPWPRQAWWCSTFSLLLPLLLFPSGCRKDEKITKQKKRKRKSAVLYQRWMCQLMGLSFLSTFVSHFLRSDFTG